jgi:hypothetical protein
MLNKLVTFCEQRRLIAVFKEPYMDMPETVVMFYILTNLYKANPQLLQIQFENNMWAIHNRVIFG